MISRLVMTVVSTLERAAKKNIPAGGILVKLVRALVVFTWRWRRFTSPLVVATTLLVTAQLVHLLAPSCWRVPLVIGIGTAVPVGVAGDRLSSRLGRLVEFLLPDSVDKGKKGVLDRPVERLYFAMLFAGAGLWVSWVSNTGLDAPAFRMWIVGVASLGAPWWWHRRIRKPHHQSKYIRLWPLVTEQVKIFQGSKPLPAKTQELPKGGLVMTVQLKGGLTIEDVGTSAQRIASVFSLRHGAVALQPGENANWVNVRIMPKDPWEKYIPHPLIEEPQTISLGDNPALAMGLYEDGQVSSLVLRHAKVIGSTGGGKSKWLESFLIHLLSADDAVVMGIDMANGATLGVWENTLCMPLAEDEKSAFVLLTGLLGIISEREKILSDSKRSAGDEGANDELDVGPGRPWIVLVIDEYPDLISAGGKPVLDLLERIAKRARKVRVRLALFAQNPTKNDIGSTELGNQFNTIVGLALDNRQSLNLWGSLRKQGWDSQNLDAGVYLLKDFEHTVPKQQKGFFVSATERAIFIRSAKHRGVKMDYESKDAYSRAIEGLDLDRLEESGHYPELDREGLDNKMTAAKVIYKLLEAEEPLGPSEISDKTGININTVKKALALLRDQKKAIPETHGQWVIIK